MRTSETKGTHTTAVMLETAGTQVTAVKEATLVTPATSNKLWKKGQQTDDFQDSGFLVWHFGQTSETIEMRAKGSVLHPRNNVTSYKRPNLSETVRIFRKTCQNGEIF